MAARALIAVEPLSGSEVLSCLLNGLETEKDEELLLEVCITLALLGTQAAAAAPILRQHLATATGELRDAVLHALRKVSA
jgi:hypothetical protein